MRRWFARILICLLLGVVSTVAVAWFCFYAADHMIPRVKKWVATGDGVNALWLRHASDGWPEPPDRHQAWEGLFASGRRVALSVGGSYWVPLDATAAELREIYRGGGSFDVDQIDCGFPFAGLRIESWCGSPTLGFFAKTNGNDGFAVAGYTLPRRVIPIGFAIDTLLYAALWLALFVGFGTARRGMRKRRGRCPLCAYNLRGDLETGCPECGWNRAEDAA